MLVRQQRLYEAGASDVIRPCRLSRRDYIGRPNLLNYLPNNILARLAVLRDSAPVAELAVASASPRGRRLSRFVSDRWSWALKSAYLCLHLSNYPDRLIARLRNARRRTSIATRSGKEAATKRQDSTLPARGSIHFPPPCSCSRVRPRGTPAVDTECVPVRHSFIVRVLELKERRR